MRLPGRPRSAVPAAEPLYQIRRARDGRELDAAFALRHQVFCLEQGVPEHEERDGRDADGVHLVAIGEDGLLGTCRLLFVGEVVQFSRLVVAPAVRRRGIASALLAAADAEAGAAGCRRLVLHAQIYARELYERAGYRPCGREFVEAGIRHIAMEKRL
jgi:predicted GNAT family N-acyltransferase